MKFTKKPVSVEAVPFNNDEQGMEIRNWVGRENCDIIMTEAGNEVEALAIHTLEGTMRVDRGDWVIQGVKGEFYPCKPDIFEETYEPTAYFEARQKAVETEKDEPKTTPEPAESVTTAEPKEWIERQEEERRAWAIGSAIEILQHADSWDQNTIIELAKQIVAYVKDESADLNAVDATDQFYLVMGQKIEEFMAEWDVTPSDSSVSELLIDCVDALAKEGVRLKDGTRVS